jgi:hypothetical protein
MGGLDVRTGNSSGAGATFKKKKVKGLGTTIEYARRYWWEVTLQDMFSFNNASECEVFFRLLYEEYVYLFTRLWSLYRHVCPVYHKI